VSRIRRFLQKLLVARKDEPQVVPAAANQHRSKEPDSVASRLRGTPYQKGDFIGQHYEVRGLLGEGGLGFVYQVYSHEATEVFAMKTFKDEFQGNENIREMFRKEAQLWIDMERHPYLVRAYYVEEISHRLYIVMEHIARGDTGLNTLHEYLRYQPPDFAQSLRWAIQFCHGMEYAYSKGLRCHRDIKPGNIMIANDKTVKISDFGLAGVTEGRRATAQTPQSQNRVGTWRSDQTIPVGGTITHMPPEQFIDSASCDQRSDIYSFGVVLYEMTSGGLPFFVPPPSGPGKRGWTESMWKLHSEAPVPRLDSKLFPLIQRCLEKKPQRRYQNFRDLRKDLEALLERTTGERIKPPTLEDLKPWEWGNKGVSLNDLGRFEEALYCHNRAIELNPRSETAAKAWSNKALTLRALNRLDEAVECCDRALELDPAHVSNLINKAAILDGLGRYEESVACCDRALELAPNNSKAWVNRGKALSGLGRFADVLQCDERAVSLAPGDALAWNNKGTTLKKLKRFEEALSCYDKALQVDPRALMFWTNKGNVLIDMRRFEEAVACFAKANELDPKNPLAWFNKAYAEEQLGRTADAIRSYEQLILVGDAGAQSKLDLARKRLSELWKARKD